MRDQVIYPAINERFPGFDLEKKMTTIKQDSTMSKKNYPHREKKYKRWAQPTYTEWEQQLINVREVQREQNEQF